MESTVWQNGVWTSESWEEGVWENEESPSGGSGGAGVVTITTRTLRFITGKELKLTISGNSGR